MSDDQQSKEQHLATLRVGPVNGHAFLVNNQVVTTVMIPHLGAIAGMSVPDLLCLREMVEALVRSVGVHGVVASKAPEKP